MTGLAETIALPRGASFHRADLHIHSFGGSHDVRDPSMTPAGIVAQAAAMSLDLIALTDHNEITNVEAGIEAAQGTAVWVVPGVELSTAQGHLLAYLPDLQRLRKFHGRLDFADAGKPNSRCRQSMLECLQELSALGGFGILAHVDVAGGFEVENPGESPHKIDVLCHPALLGVELRQATSDVSYSDTDPVISRVQTGRERCRRLGLGAKQWLARVLFSDSHSIVSLGRNAAGDKRLTRIKMDKPSFGALRIALEDGDARIRIEELLPVSVPQVLGVRLSGGFLDGQAMHFSPNLNCIIGGRGTGKSTTFEAVRMLSGDQRPGAVVDSEVWPPEVTLYWRDAAGASHSVQRLFGEDVVNLDDPDFGPTTFKVDCYGQGDTAKLSQRAQSDPLALLDYLDRFVGLSDETDSENAARDRLLELQTQIEEAELRVSQIPQYERALKVAQQQLIALDKAKATDVIRMQRELADEREVRARVVEHWTAAQRALSSEPGRERLRAIQSLADPQAMVVGGDELSAIMKGALVLDAEVGQVEKDILARTNKFDALVAEQSNSWKAKENEALRVIEAKRKELEVQGVRLDMGFIQKLARDEASHKSTLSVLMAWKPRLEELRKQRAAALKERWAARDKVATKRTAYGRLASRTLAESLSDLSVTLKYVPNGCSPQAAALIQETMGWRTNQVPRARFLTEIVTVPTLLQIVERRKAGDIANAASSDGTKPFSKAEADEIITRLSDQKVRFALERCEVHDMPRLVVSQRVEPGGGKAAVHVVREFAKLSLGQQQSILLALLLSANGTDPLVIDQPEDNLDGEFIYSTFVPVLRRAKERRQIIIVTHNANIAVLGDAEQIIVLKSSNDRGIVTATGSIDEPSTRDLACAILEGAREAFARRAKIYGPAGAA